MRLRAVTSVILAAMLASGLGGCSSLAGLGGGGKAGTLMGSSADAQSPTDAAGTLRDARAHFKANDFGLSASLYKRALELDPANPEAYVGLGASYDRLGRFDLADTIYGALFKLTGGTAQYYNNAGYSLMLRGNLKGALASFRKAQSLDPDNVVIANNIQLLSNAAKGA